MKTKLKERTQTKKAERQTDLIKTNSEEKLTEIYNQVRELNGDDTEEDLNMAIAKELLRERKDKLNRNTLEYTILEPEADIERVQKNGVYVYKFDYNGIFIFNKYNSISEAVRNAVYEAGATVICNGRIVTYDLIDNNTAYYIENSNRKHMRIVKI